ncbi:MAG: hypothetical protein HY707_00390 [Ignavibacteriae bacterium]|nr:hypothetical protein [Ignavibacteriota bacterium]
MSTEELIEAIRSLPERERESFLYRLLLEAETMDEIQRLGYLSLVDRAFDFWNDPREDVYQDYARARLNE